MVSVIFEMETVADVLYISPANLARRWDISPSAVYHMKSGTDKLTRIYLDEARKNLRFLRSEVEKIEVEILAKAKKLKSKKDAAVN